MLPLLKHRSQGLSNTYSVFLMPVKDCKEDFSQPEDEDLLQYGKVQILFSVLIPSRSDTDRVKEADEPLIKYLRPFHIQGESCM